MLMKPLSRDLLKMKISLLNWTNFISDESQLSQKEVTSLILHTNSQLELQSEKVK